MYLWSTYLTATSTDMMNESRSSSNLLFRTCHVNWLLRLHVGNLLHTVGAAFKASTVTMGIRLLLRKVDRYGCS